MLMVAGPEPALALPDEIELPDSEETSASTVERASPESPPSPELPEIATGSETTSPEKVVGQGRATEQPPPLVIGLPL